MQIVVVDFMLSKIFEKETGQLVYKEDMPSSDKRTRVLALVCAEESSDVVLNLYLSFQDKMTNLERKDVAFVFPGGQQFSIEFGER